MAQILQIAAIAAATLGTGAATLTVMNEVVCKLFFDWMFSFFALKNKRVKNGVSKNVKLYHWHMVLT